MVVASRIAASDRAPFSLLLAAVKRRIAVHGDLTAAYDEGLLSSQRNCTSAS